MSDEHLALWRWHAAIGLPVERRITFVTLDRTGTWHPADQTRIYNPSTIYEFEYRLSAATYR